MKSVGIFVSMNLVGALVTATVMAQVAPTPSTVSVSTRRPLGPVPPHPVGANAAVWDGNLLDSTLPELLRDAGVRMLRYPGGSTADVYHWDSNTTVSGQSYADPNNTFDAFMGVVEAARAQAMITVNYGSGTPSEAADWVRYANRGGRDYDGPVPTFTGASTTGHGYHVKFWEIGNEIYGNGTYGASWEYDVNGLGPSVYAERFVSYSAAMKAVDPFIKIGAVLTAPGNWPDGQTSAASPVPWDDTVLAAACDTIDFVDIHWYPQGPTGETDQGLLGAPEDGESTSVSYTPPIPAMVATLRSEIARYCGAHAGDVDIMVTETNSVSYNPGKQTTSLVDALYLADSVTTWLENGVRNVDWWAIHNSPVCDTNDGSSLYGTYGFGDYGLLSVGQSCSGLSEPAAETPFPAYYGFEMTSRFLEPGGSILGTTSSASLVSAHAVRRPDGDLGVMLINKDPATSYAVGVSLDAFVPCSRAEVSTFGTNSTAIDRSVVPVSGGSFTIPVGPYSVTTVRLR
jgi:hypothetical protein